MNIAQKFDKQLDTIQAILFSFLVKLGPFFVALMPALFTGYATYNIFQPIAGRLVASFFAIVVSLAVETVGIVAIHTAIDLYNGKEAGYIKPGKFWVMASLVPFYIMAVDFTVWYAGDSFPELVRALGLVSPWLTVIVYVAVALARDLNGIKREVASTKQARQAAGQGDKKHERAVELEKLRLDYALKEVQARERARVKIEASKPELEPASASIEPASASIEPASKIALCPDCHKKYKSLQALAAHSRWCKRGVRVGDNNK